jgi:Raf kinase inhibitor-like YbhB/YbcL family protein
MPLQLISPAFNTGESVPRRYTGDGEDLSPPLAWSELPAGTAALALLCEDPDAPRTEPWVHWIIYDLPSSVSELPEGISPTPELRKPFTCRQGRNSWEKNGYGGPAPPRKHGVHHYIFTLYALRQPTGLAPGASKADLLKAIEGHVLETATLVGLYER